MSWNKEQNRGNVYDKLTPQRKMLVDMILQNFESGAGLWKQGWRSGGTPENAVTGKKYRGVNNMFLNYVSMLRGYKDNRWLTFNQMKEREWSFKTDGEGKSLGKNAGVSVEFFELRDRETKKKFNRSVLEGMSLDEREEYMDKNVYPIRKYYTVFNGDLIDGIPEKEKTVLDESAKSERTDKFLDFWSESEAKIIYGGGQAFYSPKWDEIHLPSREDFYSLQEFYSTALHEIGHSTGHEKRLNRNLNTDKKSAEYAIEELRAEIASMFMEQDFEIFINEKEVRNNSAYIENWRNAIKDNPNVLFTAIADAERISKYVSRKETEMNKTEDPSKVYMLPSVAAALVSGKGNTTEAEVSEMPMRGKESLTRMEDIEVVERAEQSKDGEIFMRLYNGETVKRTKELDEYALMLRLGLYAEDTKQMLRIFQTSGQYHASRPSGYYENMAKETKALIEEKRNKHFMAGLKVGQKTHAGMKAKV